MYAGTGGRTTGLGYTGSTIRQKFTGYERDGETGLNFAQARYHSNLLGRFTSPDPLGASMRPADPQTFNRYAYVENHQLTRTDPSGLSSGKPVGGVLPGANGALGRARPGFSSASESGSASYVTMTSYSGVSEDGLEAAEPWPPETHDKILAMVLLGASESQLYMAQSGSREVDWSGGSLIPDTIKPEEAWKHGMVPGPWVDKHGLEKATEMAKEAAAKFTSDNLDIARDKFAIARSCAGPHKQNHLSQGLFYYGKAMHPVMDAPSPAHGWQVYRLTGDIGLDTATAIAHNRAESRLPTRAEMRTIMKQMHAALRSVTSDVQYKQFTRVR